MTEKNARSLSTTLVGVAIVALVGAVIRHEVLIDRNHVEVIEKIAASGSHYELMVASIAKDVAHMTSNRFTDKDGSDLRAWMFESMSGLRSWIVEYFDENVPAPAARQFQDAVMKKLDDIEQRLRALERPR